MQQKSSIGKRTKICYVITKGVWGGAQKYVYDLATNLPQEQFEVVVICGEGKILKDKLQLKGVRVIEISSLRRDLSFISEFKSSLQIWKTILQEKPDVLHLNSPKAAGFGGVAGRLSGTKKIIMTAHGWSFNEDRGELFKSLTYFFSCLTVLLCHKVIVIAEKERQQALKMPFINIDKIVLVRNGIGQINYLEKDSARIALQNLLPPSTFHLLPSTPWIGTISELHKNKGLEYTISALAKIKSDFAYFIIGRGEVRNNLEKLIKENNLTDKVFLLGFIQSAENYLKAFDIFTLTSTKEGLPYTLLEAGQAGLPVIASSVGGIPDIIDDKINGMLVEKANVKEISDALDFLIQNPETRNEYGTKLKEKIEKDFSIEKMLQETIKFYKI
ncbi:glycosyltransferase family 4 protein [Patescibacteria group bacterium]|nr:glycosyltransferase family 4 protein [Patescibacteria group bacterium]